MSEKEMESYIEIKYKLLSVKKWRVFHFLLIQYFTIFYNKSIDRMDALCIHGSLRAKAMSRPYNCN